MRNGRCYIHGGVLSDRRGGMLWADPLGPIRLMRPRWRAMIEARKRLGLPAPGGAPPKSARTLKSKLEKILANYDRIVETLPAPDPGNPLAKELREGALEGLSLNRRTVQEVTALLERDGIEKIDPKLLRIGNDAGNALVRNLVRAAEGEFRQRRDDALAKLIEGLRAEGALPAPQKTIEGEPA